MKCCAHILNLNGEDGLKEINASIAKVREVVRYVKSSQKKKKFYKLCGEIRY